jgi:hypothetical protein
MGTKSRRSRRGKGAGDVDGGGSYSYYSLEDEEDVDCFDNAVRRMVGRWFWKWSGRIKYI